MFEFIKSLDSKTIEKTGLIVVILVLAYFMWDLSGNKIDKVAEAVSSVNVTLTDLSTVIQGNTDVMRMLSAHR